MIPRLCVVALLVAITSQPGTVHASNMRFLEFSPSAYFTDEDWEMLRSAARKLLDEHKEGDSITWKNDKTGHHGKLTLLDSFAEFGTTCRRLEVYSDANEVSATRVVSMCKNKEGLWKVLN